MDALGAAMADEVSAEDGIPPLRVAIGNGLEEPRGVGAIAEGHEDDALDVAVVRGEERVEGVGEDAAIGGLEVGLGMV